VIQHIRDESHDHAITGHRKKRAKVKSTSTLETIEGSDQNAARCC
jgi:excinuclease ABC subunit C